MASMRESKEDSALAKASESWKARGKRSKFASSAERTRSRIAMARETAYLRFWREERSSWSMKGGIFDKGNTSLSESEIVDGGHDEISI